MKKGTTLLATLIIALSNLALGWVVEVTPVCVCGYRIGTGHHHNASRSFGSRTNSHSPLIKTVGVCAGAVHNRSHHKWANCSSAADIPSAFRVMFPR